MTHPQSTEPAGRRPGCSHWDASTIAHAFDAFNGPDRPASQRQFAHDHGIPRSTLGCWLRREDPDGADPSVAAFFRSFCGLALLARIVLAAFVVFHFRGCTGLRSIGLFLRLARLDGFVATSHGAL